MKFCHISMVFGLICLLTAPFAQAESDSNWNGFYAGINTLYGKADIKGTDLQNGSSIGSADATGMAFGGQFGWDYQADKWVAGLQLSLDKANISGDHQFINGSSPANMVTYDIKCLGTTTARGGYLLTPDTLGYAKLGGAWARTDYDDSDAAPTFGPPYQGDKEVIRIGWLAGAGIEQKIIDKLSLYAEYNYIDFGSETMTIAYNDGTAFDYKFKQRMSYVTMGLNYRF